MRGLPVRGLIAGLLACLAVLPARGADPRVEPELNEQVLLVPSAAADDPSLEASLFLPDGAGPFPLAVLHHGRLPGASRTQARWRPEALVRSWLQRGWAVLLPMRPGYGNSGGGGDDLVCRDIAAMARQAVPHVNRAVDWALARAPLDGNRIVMLGHSAGGLVALGTAALQRPGVRAVVNLAGGLQYRQRWCDWRANLESGVRTLADGSRLPVLWLYADTDRLFEPALAERLFAAWREAGGRGALALTRGAGEDGHEGVLLEAGLPGLWQHLQPWLAAAELPTAVVQPRFADTAEPPPVPSGHAAVDDVAAVPGLNDEGRRLYADFLKAPRPRAFAASPDGASGWASEGYKPQRQALRWCNANAAPGRPCRLYAVDDTVVWTPPEATASTPP